MSVVSVQCKQKTIGLGIPEAYYICSERGPIARFQSVQDDRFLEVVGQKGVCQSLFPHGVDGSQVWLIRTSIGV